MKRVIFAILVIIIITSARGEFVESAQAKYSGGSGTAGDPYKIGSAADLLALAANTGDYGKDFVLTADIDLNSNLPGNKVFTTAVIARDTDNSDWPFNGNTFTGIFDGAGHKVINLTIDTGGVGNSHLGLFGDVNGGEVKNLGLENVNIIDMNESHYLGGLAGEIDGNISNCYSTGTITGGNYSWGLGGLVGRYNYGNISNCYSTGTIAGGSYPYGFGGLVGDNYAGDVNNCHSTGTVTGGDNSSCLGGLVGENSNGAINYCYSTGDVIGGDSSGHLGGLVGDNHDNISNCFSTGAVAGGNNSYRLGGLVGWHYDTIRECYSTGDVTSGDNSSELGGLVGENLSGTIFGCYSTGGVTGGDGSAYLGGLVGFGGIAVWRCYFLVTSGPANNFGTPLTDTQMKQQASFFGWDFNNVWVICEGTNYPRLMWQIPAADWVRPDGVNFADFAYFAERWQTTGCYSSNNFCGGADFDFSGTVDIADLKIFCSYWLQGL